MGYTIDKETISTLEMVSFTGTIRVVNTVEEAEQAVEQLLKEPILGFDTETKPSFQKGASHKVALMQISTPEVCYLFRLNRIGFADALVRLLSDSSILKIGLSLRDDFGMLRKRGNFEPQGFVELQQLVKLYNIDDMSLQKIYAILFGRKISKSQRLSNWEAEELSEGQQRYAATDAWACLVIYKALRDPSFTYFQPLTQKESAQ